MRGEQRVEVGCWGWKRVLIEIVCSKSCWQWCCCSNDDDDDDDNDAATDDDAADSDRNSGRLISHDVHTIYGCTLYSPSCKAISIIAIKAISIIAIKAISIIAIITA